MYLFLATALEFERRTSKIALAVMPSVLISGCGRLAMDGAPLRGTPPSRRQPANYSFYPLY